MEDPRPRLLKAFRPTPDGTDRRLGLRVRTSGFKDAIFLCGGRLASHGGGAGSLRERIHRLLEQDNHALHKHIVLAERFTSWFGMAGNTGYKDIISFEKDFATLAGLIVLVVESAGALAELGAFCQLPSLAGRLHVILNDRYYGEKSFIMLGPVEYLKSQHRNAPYVYVWHADPDRAADVAPDTLKDIIDDIVARFDKRARTEKFDENNEGHHMLMICALLQYFIALKKSEIMQFLSDILPGLSLTESRLSQMLFVLQCRNLIDIKKYGNHECYVSCSRDSPIIGHAVPSEFRPQDMTSLKWGLLKDFYVTEPRKWRLKVATKEHRQA